MGEDAEAEAAEPQISACITMRRRVYGSRALRVLLALEAGRAVLNIDV